MSKRNWNRHRPLFTSRLPAAVRNPKIKWKIWPIIWMALKRFCMLLGAMVLISFVISSFTAYKFLNQTNDLKSTLPDEMVLYLELEGGLSEQPMPPNFANPLAPAPLTLHQLVATLDESAHDTRVKGLLVRLSNGKYSLSHIQELRSALSRFKAAGKFAYIYAPSYGEGGSGLGIYYLASAFDEIWVQPMGIVSIAGLNAQVPFFRNVLEKLGITPQFYQRKDFKSAYESLMRDDISPANRQALESLIDDYSGEIAQGIAASREIDVTRVQGLVDKGLYTASAAHDAQLVDYTDYIDVLVGNIKEHVRGDREAPNEEVFVSFESYQSASDIARKAFTQKNVKRAKNPDVALIYAVGTILDSGLGAGNVAAADEIAPAIFSAAKDEHIKTIVIRVDSPGGSPSASESILRAIEKAKEKGKTIIVSMGPTAASGGYWICAYADQIFALPTTLTGSIGVVGGKFSLGQTWDKIGVNWDSVKWGENASIWSVNTPFSEREATQINAMLDSVYDGFIARVSKGRNMSIESVESVAQGRVWTGLSAHKNGLVDQLGGLSDALDYSAQQMGLEDRHALHIITLPKPKTRLEQVLELLSRQGAVYSAMSALFQPVMDQAALIQSQNASPVLTYETLSVQ